MDHTGSDGGERTTGAGGINVIFVGDGETNANLGDSVRDRDGSYNDGEVDCTGSGGGERTIGTSGVNVVIMGDWQTNGSLEDGMWEHDGY
jgi:hypothetical protein